MWNFASKCLAGSIRLKNVLKPKQYALECSDDEVSSTTSRDDGLECPICWESFNIVENVPYVLWCGHTLCKNCILELKWAVVKFPTLPFRLPFFVSCPWCNLLSLRLVYRGNLKFPRKNYFLLWMVESRNGGRVKSRSLFSGDDQQHICTSNANSAQNIRHEESSNHDHSHVVAERLNFSIRKSLALVTRLTTKIPLIMIFLLIVIYAIPACAAILALYILISVLFALPCIVILYFAYPILKWMVREIIN